MCVSVVVDYTDTRFSQISSRTKCLPVHMGPRLIFVIQKKCGKSPDTVTLRLHPDFYFRGHKFCVLNIKLKI